MSSFMADPGVVLWRMLVATQGATAERRRWFEYGRIAVGLDILSAMKIVESLPVEDARTRESIVSALQTLLTELGMIDTVSDLYEQLAEWRMPRFVPESGPLPGAIDDADEP